MKFLIAIGISLLFVTSAAADTTCCGNDTTSAHAVSSDTASVSHPDSTTMKDTALPTFAFATPISKRAYQTAADSPALLALFPCTCGCMRNKGHTSLLTCYRKPDGAWDDHAVKCKECIEGVVAINWWITKYNFTFEEMRSLYEEKFHPERWPGEVRH